MARAKQPSDLPKPPGTEEPQIEAAAVELPAQPQAEPSPQPQAAAEDTPTQAEALKNQLRVTEGYEFDPEAALAQMDPQTREAFERMAKNEALLQAADEAAGEQNAAEGEFPEGKPEENPLSVGKELEVRAKKSAAFNQKDERNLMQKVLGDDFVVSEKDGELWFRKKGAKSKHRIDRSAFGLLKEGKFAEAGREAAGDVADMTGTGIEIAGNVAGEAASIAAGSKIGAGIGFLAVGPGGAFVGGATGAIAGAVAGTAVAAATGIAMREMAVEAFGGQNSGNAAEEFVIATGINAATLGAGVMLKGVGRKMIAPLRDALENSPKQRLYQLAQIRSEFEAITQKIGVKGQTTAQTGAQIDGAVVRLEKQLGEQVELLKTETIAKGADKPFPAENYSRAVEKILGDYGLPKDTLPVILNDPVLQGKVIQNMLKGDRLGATPENARLVRQLLGELKAGGKFKMDDLYDQLDRLRGLAEYEKSPDALTPLNKIARELRQALAKDRNGIIEAMYKDNDPHGIASAIKEYSSRIDAIDDFRNIFTRKRSVELFTDSIVSKNNSKMIAQVKELLGPESPEFQALQAEWIDQICKKSIESGSGVVNGKKLRSTLESYGEDVVNQMISPREKLTLEYIARKAEKIPYLDMLNSSAASQQAVKDGAMAIISGGKNIPAQVRLLWTLFRENADAAKYLSEEGLLELAQQQKNGFTKRQLIKVSQAFGKLIDASDVVVTKGGHKRYQVVSFEDRLKDPEFAKLFMGEQDRLIRAEGMQTIPGSVSQGAAPGLDSLTAAQAGKANYDPNRKLRPGEVPQEPQPRPNE